MLATRREHVGSRWARGVVGLVTLALAVSGAGLRADDAASPDPREQEMRERIRGMMEGVKDVPLPVIVEALTGHRVRPWEGEAREPLVAAADRIKRLIEEGRIEAARMNEAGNKVENVVLEALRAGGFDATRAKTASGRTRTTGYPDLEATIDGTAFYIEVKTFSAATIDSTQRSFYLSPSTDFKVTRDAVHVLVAVELVPGPNGVYRAQSVRWLDLSGLRCDLKYEFNASNRDLYRRESGLVIAEFPRESAGESAPAAETAAGESAEPADVTP